MCRTFGAPPPPRRGFARARARALARAMRARASRALARALDALAVSASPSFCREPRAIERARTFVYDAVGPRARAHPRARAGCADAARAYATSARAVDAIFRAVDPERARREAAPRRTGAIAIKAGMTCDWDARGTRTPLTVLWLDDVTVVKTKREDGPDGYNAVQLGYGSKRAKQVSKAELGHFVATGSGVKRALGEFRVSACGLLEPGTKITAAHFTAGQYVDVQGTTKGKGFQGPMKRWGFSGQPASHGNTKKHRAHGSIGQCQDPGRVFKGKKMAGRMGGRTRTVQSVYVYKVDTEKNLIYLKGQVPGNAGTAVRIKDALRKPPKLGEEVPMPTASEDHPVGVFVAPLQGKDPFGNDEPLRQSAS